MIQILNWITEDGLDRMKRRGWIERAREPRPGEARTLVTLWHPRQTLGERDDRYPTAVETYRSLPLDTPYSSCCSSRNCADRYDAERGQVT